MTLVATTLASINLPAVLAAQPVASVSLAGLTRGAPVDSVSAVFVSDNIVATLLPSRGSAPPLQKVVIMRWSDRALEQTASMTVSNGGQIFAASGNRLIVSTSRDKAVYSADLTQRREIPIKVLCCDSFPRVGVIGEWGENKWTVFRLDSPSQAIREGSGELISVSDGVIVYRLNNQIRTETLDGHPLGSIAVSAGSRYSHVAELAGGDRLYLTTSEGRRLVDFNGNEMLRVDAPTGWGFRHGWSAEGNRMLFDHFTVTMPLAERAIDKVFNSIFGGLGVMSEQPNGEIVRVIDTRTGGICLNLESPGKLFGPAGDYHADLSPNGRWMVLITLQELSIYQLPESCKKGDSATR